MERHFNKILRGLALITCLLTASAAQAVTFDGTLDLDDMVYTVPYDSGLGFPVNVDGALDVQRFALGNTNDGEFEVSFTPADFNADATLLGFAIANHPNDNLLANPDLLIGIVNDTATFADIFEGSQWTVIWNVAPLVTTYLSQVIGGDGNPLGPFTMDAGTDYYVFAAGGSVVANLVDFSLEVSAVPEPETWMLLMLGVVFLLFIGQYNNRRNDIDHH
jgi:hypothetical protein